MKRLILIAALGLGLAACNNTSEDTDTTTEEAAAPAAPDVTAPMVTANGSEPGTYDVTAADGTKSTSTLNADGTYQDTAADGSVTATGKWTVTDGKTCFDPDGDEAATCYTETAPGADGTFTATPDEGDPVTVKKAA